MLSLFQVAHTFEHTNPLNIVRYMETIKSEVVIFRVMINLLNTIIHIDGFPFLSDNVQLVLMATSKENLRQCIVY